MKDSGSLTPEETALLARHALLAEKQKYLSELRARYRSIQEEKKKGGKRPSCDSPSEATAQALKLAASGKLVTQKPTNKTSGFKRLHSKNLEDLKRKQEEKSASALLEQEIGASITDPQTTQPFKKPRIRPGLGAQKDTASLSRSISAPVKAASQNFVSAGFLLDNSESELNNEEAKSTVDEISSAIGSIGGSSDVSENATQMKFINSSTSEVTKGNTIMVVADGLEEERIKQIFGQFGKILRSDGRSAGKMFLTFDTVQAASDAVAEMDQASRDEVTLRVSFARHQRHLDRASDLTHSWSRISAGGGDTDAKTNPATIGNRTLRAYTEEPF